MVWNESQFGFGAGSTDSGVRQNGELTANPASGSEVNVLASQAKWAWPAAGREIFRPRGGEGSSARKCAEAQRLQCDRQAGRYGPSARAVEQVVHQKVRQPHFCMMRCMAHLGR